MTKHLDAFKVPEEIPMIIEAIGLYSPKSSDQVAP